MTEQRQRDTQQDNGDRHPRAGASPEVRLALLERDHEDLSGEVSTLVGKVDELITAAGPVIEWVNLQRQAATEQRRWWEGLMRDAIKHALGMVLQLMAVGLMSLGAMAWANPAALWGAVSTVRKLLGGG